MYKEEHIARSIEFFGKPFEHVHTFLDHMASKVGIQKHRQYLHNPEGVEKVVKLYGEEARCPALLHLYDDYEYFQYWNKDGNLLKTIEDRIQEYYVN